MKRKFIIAALVGLGLLAAIPLAWSEKAPSASWRYKMIVTVETPDGLKTGSAVRQMGNEYSKSPLSQNGNPADVRGEAVVVDLGKRGVLFALISSDSDLEFYNAFPVPGHSVGNGGSTPEGIKYYASLPTGTKASANPNYPPGYPKLVMFKDLNDPKSVTLLQEWQADERGYLQLKEDRIEELFGKGVKLKDISMEITGGPVTLGLVDKYLPKTFNEVIIKNWKTLSKDERQKLVNIVTFKQ